MFIVAFYRESGKGPKASILNSMVFQNTPTVEFNFAAMSVGEGGPNAYAYILTLVYCRPRRMSYMVPEG
jgi:hypothetical protein